MIALYVHPKNSNHLRSHSRAVKALDHSRLGLENKSGRIFCVRQVYFTKSRQQIWVREKQPFILFIHHIWGETVLWGAVFIIQTSGKMQCFTIFQDKLHSFNIRTIEARGQLVLTFHKISAKFAVHFKRVTLQHNKDLIVSIFY